MDKIIGLGRAGCAIADRFGEFSQYSVYKLDASLPADPRSFSLGNHEKIEDYEEKCPDLTEFFEGLQGDVLFVVAGGGKVSISSLRILEQIKHCSISVLYIKPDLSFGGATGTHIHNILFNAFQEYARSGLFERLYLVGNPELEKAIPPTSIKNYFYNLNEAVVSTLHMINVFNHIESVTDTFSDPPVAARISTIGFVNPEKNVDRMFFSLDNVTDIVYYYGYNKVKLNEGNNLLSQIKSSMKKKTEEGVRVSFGIFETNYEQDYVYAVNHTSVIQGQEKSFENNI
jgi:hypothetical protein